MINVYARFQFDPQIKRGVENHKFLCLCALSPCSLKRTHSSHDYFINSDREDFLFVQNFCNGTQRLCIISPYVAYFVKGFESKTVAAGRRSVLRAPIPERQLGHVIESTSACFVSSTDVTTDQVHTTNAKFSGRNSDGLTFPLLVGLIVKVPEEVQECVTGDDNAEVRLRIFSDGLLTTDYHDILVVVLSTSQLPELLTKPKRSFLLVTSTALKYTLVAAGFDTQHIWVVNPWNILDISKTDACENYDSGVRMEPIVKSSAGVSSLLSEKVWKPAMLTSLANKLVGSSALRITLLHTLVDGSDAQNFAASLRQYGFIVTSVQIILGQQDLLQACSSASDTVLFYFRDDIPDWVPVTYLILQGKVVLFDGVHDLWLKRYLSAFAYSYDTTDAALRILHNISRNRSYFFSVSQFAAQAFRKVIDTLKHEELCLAMREFSAIKKH